MAKSSDQLQTTKMLKEVKMTRKQFLSMLGGGFIGAVGLLPLLQKAQNSNLKAHPIGSYSSGVYGGDKDSGAA